ncbi:5-hydroxytryptamine receptor 3A-like [Dendrobates tinctorius]|uniref:5-hydroxytryptamine receptor 3A-like n=1 Tax=Dendrobates tinctorius TaxID=92724 RepID=UPI003CC9FDA4
MTEADSKNPVTPFYQISYDGFISAGKPMRIVSSCSLNIFYYPFDTQTCNITFGPYISDDVNFISEMNSSYLYEETRKVFFSIGEWNLINFTVSDIENRARYQITVKRNSSVQVIAFIVPICFLVILDIIGMFIHLRDMERLMFKITVVLGFAFLLVVLNQILSTSESPPLLSLFCCICMAIMVASIIGSIATSYMLNFAETDIEVPRWMTFLVIKCLARILCFKVQHSEWNVPIVPVTEKDNNGTAQISVNMSGTRNNISKDGKNTLEIQLLKTLLSEVEIIHQKLIHSDGEDHNTDWHTVALVVDRLFLVLYLIAIFILFVVVFTLWSRN